MKMRRKDEGAFVTDEEIPRVDATTLRLLREEAPRTALKRIRFCAHKSTDEAVQEMIIALCRETYLPPHKHPGKSESFLVVEGKLDIVLFNEKGTFEEVIHMGPLESGKVFYYRLSRPHYHAVVVQSDVVIFLETSSGPFIPGDMAIAPWAPKASDPAATSAYMAQLRKLAEEQDRAGS